MYYNTGKLSHLKFMPDDIDPKVHRHWCRIHDEVNGLIIFMSDLHEDHLINSDIWLIDGTFRSTPKGYNQILNIMGANTLKNTFLTTAHIIMMGKKDTDYTFALKSFLSLLILAFAYLKINIIASDFEKALFNGINISFNEYSINKHLKRNTKCRYKAYNEIYI